MQKPASRTSLFRNVSPLSLRLLAYILLSSSIFTLFATAIQIYSDYRHDLSAINNRLAGIEISYESSLSRSLWALDQNLLQVQMEGILSLPDIVFLRLRIYPDSELVLGKRPPRDARILTRQFELIHTGSEITPLGQLEVTATLAGVHQDLQERIWVILITQFFKTLLISVLIVWIFHRLVTRHLGKMATYAREFSLTGAEEPLVLDRPRTRASGKDELGQVTTALNQMRRRLHEDFERQSRDRAEIRKLSMAVEQSPASVMICDRQWRIEFVNQKFCQLTGFQESRALGQHPGQLAEDTASGNRDLQNLWQTIRLQVQRVGVWQGEINSRRRNGEFFWEQVVVTPIKDAEGRVSHYLIMGEDISIRKRYEQQLLRQANYDVLTGLPNRMLALDRLKLALAQSRRESTMVGVMFLDLDNFKHINDTMGHDAGDCLLVEASRRISGCLRGSSTVARLGGDEFLVVLPGLRDPAATEQVANRILDAFSKPFDLTDQEVFVSTSIGIAIYPTDSDDSGTLLQHADAAMYEAKHKGKSAWERFVPEMKEVSHERLQMESRMRRALELNEFELWYQPIVETETGRVTGAEALLRWNSPGMGLVMPDRFIPLAEETGLIIPIGKWVLEQACVALSRLTAATGLPLTMAVNVSPRQFKDPEFVAATMNAIEEGGVETPRIELEITERLILDNSIETALILRELDQAGIRLSVDDFGTGYSALSYLKSYPFDTLKIDKSFIGDVLTEKDDAALVRAILTMAHSLGLKVIAEGVENEAQARFLIDHRCDYAQGYFYSRPMPEAEFLDWLRGTCPDR